MNEAEWLACSDPTLMLDFLNVKHIHDRRVWRFLAAYLPVMFGSAGCVDCRSKLEVMDRIAEHPYEPEAQKYFGEARRGPCQSTPEDSRKCHLKRAYWYLSLYVEGNLLWVELWNAFLDLEVYADEPVFAELRHSRPAGWPNDANSAWRAFRQSQASQRAPVKKLLDVVGNPFRPVSLSPSWLAWNDGAIGKMAQAIYDDRAFDRLPILADALEEAGCADREILDHCRSGGEHVRGCWVVDLLLGKS